MDSYPLHRPVIWLVETWISNNMWWWYGHDHMMMMRLCVRYSVEMVKTLMMPLELVKSIKHFKVYQFRWGLSNILVPVYRDDIIVLSAISQNIWKVMANQRCWRTTSWICKYIIKLTPLQLPCATVA